MRWKGRKGSSNVEDRRGGRSGGGGVGRKFGLGTIVIIIIAVLFGQDPMQLLDQMQGGSAPTSQTSTSAPTDELGQFVSVVLKDTEDVWDKIFRENNLTYRQPVLVIFDGRVNSGCGPASAATGPFYCPADQKLYIDLSFYRQLKDRFNAPGDFAMAYVVAHEVAHHVQNLLGYSDHMQRQRGRVSQQEYNQLSVRLELQADYLAGVWANHAQKMKNILEEGDVEEALRAAQAIGDDHLQMQSQGYVDPRKFTHGTSEQRMKYFHQGKQTGSVDNLDYFFEVGYNSL